jgi:flagellar motility protein MotE (MotC chaperone)
MPVLPSLAVIGVLLGAPAWAATPPSVAHASSTAAQVPPTVRQRMQHDQVEVTRLQKEVARQESASQRASRRVEQQYAQIAELRRQLLQVQAAVPDDHP